MPLRSSPGGWLGWVTTCASWERSATTRSDAWSPTSSAEDGVDTGLLFTDPAGTPRSVNLVFPDGRRTFFYDGGAHMTLRPPAALVEAALDGADLVVSSLPNWGRAGAGPRAQNGHPGRRGPAGRPRGGRPVPHRLHRRSGLPLRLGGTPAGPGGGRGHLARDGARPICRARPGRSRRPARLASGRAHRPPSDDSPPIGPSTSNHRLHSGRTTGCPSSTPPEPATPWRSGSSTALLALGLDPVDALHRGQLLARIVASDTGGDAPFDRVRLDALARSAPPPRPLPDAWIGVHLGISAPDRPAAPPRAGLCAPIRG